jgi:hypothetical protein
MVVRAMRVPQLLLVGVVVVALAAAPAVVRAQGCPPDDVWAEVVGGSALVHHDAAEFNCCPVMEYEVAQNGWDIDIREIEVQPQCFCICCFDLIHQLDGLAPGTYTVRVFGAYGCDPDPCGTVQLTIPVWRAYTKDLPTSVALTSIMSGCGGWSLFSDNFESGDPTGWSSWIP